MNFVAFSEYMTFTFYEVSWIQNPYIDAVIEGGSTRWYPENAMQLHIYHGLLKYKESMHKDEKIITQSIRSKHFFQQAFKGHLLSLDYDFVL